MQPRARSVDALVLACTLLLPAAGTARADGPHNGAPLRWTRLYVGINAGLGRGGSVVDEPLRTADPALAASGWVAGGLIGYNWQWSRNWMLGLEADINLSDIDGNASAKGALFVGAASAEAKRSLEWFATLRARLGYLPNERLMLFATGGLAVGMTGVSASIANDSAIDGVFVGVGSNLEINCVAKTTCIAGSDRHVSTGWTVGGGLEYAAWGNATIRFDYLYLDLGRQSLLLTAVNEPSNMRNQKGSETATIEAATHVVRAGLNFKF